MTTMGRPGFSSAEAPRLLQLPMQMSMAMLVLRINSARFLSHRARIWPFGELGDAGYTVSFGMFDQGIG